MLRCVRRLIESSPIIVANPLVVTGKLLKYPCLPAGRTTMSGFLGANVCHAIKSSSRGRHSEEAVVEFPNLKVWIIPALADNFMYLVIDKGTKKAFVIDPVEPESVLDIVKQEQATLTAALITHHHWDHAGGNSKLLTLHDAEHPQSDRLNIYGGDDRIDGINKKVGHDDKFAIGTMQIRCLFTPCHTTGHICYFVVTSDIDMQKPLVFTGDTMFIAGCGRFFEGTADQMHTALNSILGTLPEDTLVFCGHEYTAANLKFVLSVEKENHEARLKLQWAEKMRAIKHATVPSTIGEEQRYNIFMRSALKSVQQLTNTVGPVECMDKLRTMKNNF